jgi:hypothetical protein
MGSPRYEYEVIRIGEDKQKGFLGGGRMKELLNREGEKGWRLVTIQGERAVFVREKQ